MVELHETEVDGVRCFWVDSGRPTLNASLFFRTGMVDETFATRGRRHLLEHLALHDRGRGALQVNGSVSLLQTSFDAHGPAEDVAVHLSEVTTWLADPDFTHLDHEIKVLRAESHARGGSAVGDALLWRYGARGPGLAGMAEFGLATSTQDALRGVAGAAFTRRNAVLALDGPPPPGLRLTLADGHGTAAVPVAVPCVVQEPASYVSPGLLLTGTTERSVAAPVLPELIQKSLWDQLRNTDGTTYSPWSHYEPVDQTTALVAAGTDLNPSTGRDAAKRAFTILHRLAEDGPDQSDLDDVLAQVVQGMRDPYSAPAFAWRTAQRWLQGHEPVLYEDVIAETAAITVHDLAEVAAQVEDSLYIGAAEGIAPPEKATALVRRVPEDRPGTEYRSWNWPADDTRLRVGDGHVQIFDRTGRIGAALDEVVGLVQHPDGSRTLVSADGWNLTVERAVWHRGEQATALLDARVPAELHVPALVNDAPDPPQRSAWWRRWWFGFRRSLDTVTGIRVYALLLTALTVVAIAATRILPAVVLGLAAGSAVARAQDLQEGRRR